MCVAYWLVGDQKCRYSFKDVVLQALQLEAGEVLLFIDALIVLKEGFIAFFFNVLSPGWRCGELLLSFQCFDPACLLSYDVP